MSGVRSRIKERKLKREIHVGLDDRVFKPAVKEAVTSASHEPGRQSIGKTYARSEIGEGHSAQRAVPRADQIHILSLRGSVKIRGERSVAATLGNQKSGGLIRLAGIGAGQKIGLRVIAFGDQPEVLPAQSQVEGQFRGCLPIVLKIERV